MSQLAEILQTLNALPPKEREAVEREAMQVTAIEQGVVRK